jgi:hypothetical protein
MNPETKEVPMKLKSACFALAILFSAVTALAQVTGLGTVGTIPVWKGKTSLGSSKIAQIGGNVGVNTKTPGAQLDVENSSTTIPAIVGNSFATTGSTTGMLGLASSPTGTAVAGLASAATGTAIGGYFRTASSSGTALLGVATATTGSALGIYGETSSPGSDAILGSQLATTGSGAGIAGETASDTGGAGVIGRATGSSGGASAFFGDTNSATGIVALFRAHTGGDILVGQLGPDGTAANVFRVDSTGKGFFDGGTQTGGADFAESVAVAKEFTPHEPGDLLIVDTGGKSQLKLSREPYSTLVAGIYSTKPGVLATVHKMDETASAEIPLAIVGIVPCKVSAENGAIRPGDLLVTSSTPGHAMKGTDRSRMLGAVVGKALEPWTEGKGVIQVLVTLQ